MSLIQNHVRRLEWVYINVMMDTSPWISLSSMFVVVPRYIV